MRPDPQVSELPIQMPTILKGFAQVFFSIPLYKKCMVACLHLPTSRSPTAEEESQGEGLFWALCGLQVSRGYLHWRIEEKG